MTVRAQDQKGTNSINRVWNKNNLAVMLPVPRTVCHTLVGLVVKRKDGDLCWNSFSYEQRGFDVWSVLPGGCTMLGAQDVEFRNVWQALAI